MKKAAIYARYSGENQRDESIDAQIFAIEEYAKRNNIIGCRCSADFCSNRLRDFNTKWLQTVVINFVMALLPLQIFFGRSDLPAYF